MCKLQIFNNTARDERCGPTRHDTKIHSVTLLQNYDTSPSTEDQSSCPLLGEPQILEIIILSTIAVAFAFKYYWKPANLYSRD